MISNYNKLMERMYETADRDDEVQTTKANIKKILKQVDMLKEVYEGESVESIRKIMQSDLDNSIIDYAKIGSKIIGTQIQYFTQIYLEKNPNVARNLFDKYKKETSKEPIRESYPFEIKKAARLFIRETVNAMNVQDIEKTYDKLDDFIDISGNYFANKLKKNYIQLLGKAGKFFKRYNLLEEYNLAYHKTMESLGIIDIKYEVKGSKQKSEISIEDTFTEEYLEGLDLYTIMTLNAFWQNRMAKDSKRIHTAFYVIDKLHLLENETALDDVDAILDEDIKELIARKLFVNRLTTFKVRNYTDETSKFDSSLEERIEGYSREYNKKYNSNLEQEIANTEYEQANNENIYLIKEQSISNLIRILEEKANIPNWGIVPERSDDINVLVSIDLPGYNMPISLHIPKDILVSSLNSLNTEKVASEYAYVIPVYDGHSDFERDNKYIPTNLLMPLSDTQKKTIVKLANKTEKTDPNYNLLNHLAANAKGEMASHLKVAEIRNGVTFISRKRKYYDLIGEGFYEKDSKGQYTKFNGGYVSEGR